MWDEVTITAVWAPQEYTEVLIKVGQTSVKHKQSPPKIQTGYLLNTSHTTRNDMNI
jgi:hypothetical protein